MKNWQARPAVAMQYVYEVAALLNIFLASFFSECLSLWLCFCCLCLYTLYYKHRLAVSIFFICLCSTYFFFFVVAQALQNVYGIGSSGIFPLLRRPFMKLFIKNIFFQWRLSLALQYFSVGCIFKHPFLIEAPAWKLSHSLSS